LAGQWWICCTVKNEVLRQVSNFLTLMDLMKSNPSVILTEPKATEGSALHGCLRPAQDSREILRSLAPISSIALSNISCFPEAKSIH
jgi:hypothetical protein